MGGALCLFVAIYGKPNSFCNLFAVHPNSLYILFSVLTLSALSFSSLSSSVPSFSLTIIVFFSISFFFFHFWSLFKNLHPFTLVHAPVSLYLLPLQWRASGQTGGLGRNAAWLVTQGPSRGRGAVAHRCTAGLNAKAPIRRAENAPTLRAPVTQISIHSHMLSDGIMHTQNMHYLKASTWLFFWFIFHTWVIIGLGPNLAYESVSTGAPENKNTRVFNEPGPENGLVLT